MELFLPVVQADVQLEETYCACAPAPDGPRSTAERATLDKLTVPCPILSIYGAQPGRDAEATAVGADAAQLWLTDCSTTAASRLVALAAHDWYLPARHTVHTRLTSSRALDLLI